MNARSSATSSDKDVLPLADALRPALLRASRALRREAQRAGVSALDAQLLGAVKKHAGIGVSELAEREQMTRASMSGHVKRLEAAGWIARAARRRRRPPARRPDADRQGRQGARRHPPAPQRLAGRAAGRAQRRGARGAGRRGRAAGAPGGGPLMADAGRCAAPIWRNGARPRPRSPPRSRASRSPSRWRDEPEDKPFSSLVPAIIGAANLMQTLSATVIANALPTMARHAARGPGPASTPPSPSTCWRWRSSCRSAAGRPTGSAPSACS